MRSSPHSSHFLTVSLKQAQRLVPPGLVLSKVGPSTQSFNALIVLGFERVEENVHTDSATEHTYYIPSPTDLAGLRNVVEDWIDPMPAQGASWLRANLRVKIRLRQLSQTLCRIPVSWVFPFACLLALIQAFLTSWEGFS